MEKIKKLNVEFSSHLNLDRKESLSWIFGKVYKKKKKKRLTNQCWDVPMTKGRHVVMSCCCWCCDNLGGPGSSSAGGVVTGASGGSVVVGANNGGGGGGGLGIASGLSAMLSLVVVTVAISTGEWLLTEEKLPKTSSNASVEPDSKVTYSGLWRVCVAISE